MILKSIKQHTFYYLTILFFISLVSIWVLSGFHSNVQASPSISRVYDYAKLLTAEEIAQVEGFAQNLYSKNNTHFLVVTTNDRSEFAVDTSVSEEEQTENFALAVYHYFQDTYREEINNCVILAIDMSHRYISIIAQGDATSHIDRQREQLISEKLVSPMKESNYLETCKAFMTTTHRYLQIKPGINPDAIYLNLWFQFLMAYIISAIIVVILVYNSGGKVTTTHSTYLDNTNSKLLARRDRYLHTSVTRTKRVSDDSNNSSSDNSSSSSGGNHGGSHF